MPEYVERKWLLNEAEKQFKNYKPRSIPNGEEKWIAQKFVIESAPAANVAPVEAGTWMLNDNKSATVCSVCKISPFKDLDADIGSA